MRKWMRDGDWPQLQYADRRVFIQVYAISLGWQQCNSQWYKFSSEVCGEHICLWIGLFECMLTPGNWLGDTDSSSSCIWQLKDSRWFLSKETSIKLLERIISDKDAMNYPKGQAIDPVSIDMHQKSWPETVAPSFEITAKSRPLVLWACVPHKSMGSCNL